jgi:secondary thiamine-phosphate synthase enzyme
MKVHTEYLKFHTDERHEFLHITPQVREAVRESGVKEGLVLINPMHITAAVIVNDNESGLHQDFLQMLKRLVPMEGDYLHHQTGEDNAYAHLWRQLLGHQVTMPITGGDLDLGPWEAIFYCEFDGQRDKRVLVKIVGE